METIINVKRKWLTEQSTIGELFFDNDSERVCFTLEDKVRKEKIHGITAIPEGIYEIVISYSNRFKKLLPLLMNVQNYDGVRLHCGNRPDQTEGCILLGLSRGEDMVLESRKAFDIFYPRLYSSLQAGKAFLNITSEIAYDTRKDVM